MTEQDMTMEQAELKVLTDQVARLTKLPAPGQSPDALESGIVRIFNDDNFGPNHYSIEIEDYASDQRHRMYNDCYNKANWVSWNLPLGTVMTLTEFDKTLEGNQSLADIRGCGRCLELVGSGKTEAVDLSRLHMHDCFKGFFWREVDLKIGAIELFDATKEGLEAQKVWGRHTIFLSEWAPGITHSIVGWDLNDRISCARWGTLNDRQTVSLFEHADGSGSSYKNIKGWGKHKEEPDFHRLDHGDKFSSFSWTAINPVKEKVEPIIIIPDSANASMVIADKKGENGGRQPQPAKISITEAKTEEITVETTDTTATSVTASVQTTAKAGVEGVSSYEVQWSLSVEHSWEHSDKKSTKTTETKALTIEESFSVSPRCTYEAKLIVRIGKIADRLYKTKATRWYKDHLTGCVKDGKLYKREEDVVLNISGSLHCSVETQLHEHDMDGSKLDAAVDKGQKVANDAVDGSQRVGKDLRKSAHELAHKLVPTDGLK